jgi:hypothetical protein
MIMNKLFVRQVWKDYESTRQKLQGTDTALAHLQLELFDMMRGPWDRRNQNTPFAVEKARPEGAGFYPESLFTKKEDFEEYAARFPEEKGWLENLATMLFLVEQNGKRILIPWPYSMFFKEELEPAAGLLLAAAKLTENESLKRFLKSRFVFQQSDLTHNYQTFLTGQKLSLVSMVQHWMIISNQTRIGWILIPA